MRRIPMLRRRTLLLTSAILAGALLGWWAFATGTVAAQTATSFSIESVGSQVGLGNANLRQTIINVIRWALGFVTLAAVGYLIYGGYIWLTAGGNEQRVEKAKQIILQALIGLVIILLAWAIVSFVARTFKQVTNNGNPGGGGGGCIGFDCPQINPRTFDLTAVTTCAARPNYDTDVPRASTVQLTFNHDVDAASVQAAVASGDPKLMIERCDNPDPDNPNKEPCVNWSTPKPVDAQVFSGTAPKGKAGTPLAEWVAKFNTISFYHLSFSTDETNPDNRYFEANTTYRLTIPAKNSTTAIKDTTEPGRKLQKCQRNAAGDPIEGDDAVGSKCNDDAADRIVWKFTTGSDTAGPTLSVAKTVPSSTYLGGVGTPDRDVPRNGTLSVEFNNAIDAQSIVSGNFDVWKYLTPPDPVTGQGGSRDASPLPGTNFTIRPNFNGRGALLQPKDKASYFEPFTWYQVVVKDFRSLCGLAQAPNPYEWVFETNDAMPGVAYVYPTSDNICPTSEVFIKFATSMYNLASSSDNCQAGSGGSYVTTGSLSPSPGRGFVVIDEFDPNDPNHTCTKYGFTPESKLLTPGASYTASVGTNLVIDQNGTKLSKTWSFKADTADQCIQPPYIDRVSPTAGQAGSCVSVIGRYFEKKLPGTSTRESDGQNSGDVLQLSTENQTIKQDAAGKAIWKNNAIVSAVTPGALTVGPHEYTVTVNYPSPIGPLPSNPAPFQLQSGSGGTGPCLLSLDPDSGPPGSLVTLSGSDFGSPGANSEILYSPAPPPGLNFTPANWNDTRISNALLLDTTVSPQAGLISVQRNDSALSNQLPFDVTVSNGNGGGNSTPHVVQDSSCDLVQNIVPSPNPKPNDALACINSAMSARFTVDMDKASIETTDNIYLEKCDPTCTKVPSNVSFQPNRGFTLTPTANLTPSTQYRVTITTNVKSVGPANIPLPSPYSWSFSTKSGDATCPISAVTVTSGVAFGTAVQASQSKYTFRATRFGVNLAANAVDTECRTLNNSGVDYSWTNDNTTTVTLSSANGPSILATDAASIVAGTGNVQASTEGKQSSPVAIQYDPTSCQTNSDCDTNALGEACGAPGSSECINSRCTPVVTGLDPVKGPIGTWTTVKGCWFGGYDGAQSKVTFLGDPAAATDDQIGLIPDQAICGSPSGTWTNERIVREVPDRSTAVTSDDAVPGPIEVRRFDGLTAAGPTFTVNTDPLAPGLCKVSPRNGPVTTGIIASGARFGNDEAAKRTSQDQVNYLPVVGGSATVFSNYLSWADTKVSTQVPVAAPVGGGDIRVKNDDLDSNPWSYTVTTVGAGSCLQRCSVDSECPAGQGCGSDFCCDDRPKITPGGFSPPQGATNVCRNTQAAITFDQPLATVPSSVVIYTDGTTPKNGTAQTNNTATTGTVAYQPGLLNADSQQTMNLQAGGVRNRTGIAADLNGTPLKFTTGPDICTIDQIRVTTADGLNTHRFTSVGEVMEYRAEAVSNRNGEVLVNLPGSYAWTWTWQSGNGGIASVNMQALTATNSLGKADVTAKANGSTVAQATATVTEPASDAGKTKSGSGGVVVDLCDNPWTNSPTGYIDSASNCDTVGNGCDDFHFTMSYCRGQNGGNLLPDFSYTGSDGQLGMIEGGNSSDTNRLKSIFFKESKDSRDAIGLLIYNNTDLLSPYDWFHQRFPLDSSGSATTINGYPALRTGTTTYIGVTDLNSSNQLRGVIVVLDFNSNNASNETKAIYNQLLAALTFNTNLTIDNKNLVIRDTKRTQDLAGVKILLESYKQAHGQYPPLSGGSYLVGLSTSVWPSWQQTLGNTFGQALNTDPINNFSPPCEPPPAGVVPASDKYEKTTCWSESQKKFQCPSDSHIYAYRAAAGGTSYTLYANMEYTGPGRFQGGNSGLNACSGIAGSSCSCFNYTIQ